MTRVAFIGNFRAPRCTENGLAYGLRQLGVEVVGYQQERVSAARPMAWARTLLQTRPDLVLYTRSHGPTALPAGWTRVWRTLEAQGIRTASYHLDVFVGVRRDGIHRQAYRSEPLFTTGTVITPDPRLADRIETDRTRHVWMPPAADVRHDDPTPTPIPELAGRVVFVGSRYGEGRLHPEYPFRARLLDWAARRYGDRFVWYGGQSPRGALRGLDLWNVYASDAVIIGDSCFAGARPFYWSDRITENLAWGGLLLHPDVEGLDAAFDRTIYTWPAGDLDRLGELIDRTLDSLGAYRNSRLIARDVTRERHLYLHRARALLEETGLR